MSDATQTTREARLEAALKRISVSAQTALEEDDIYTTPKQSRDSLCKAVICEVQEALHHGE